MTDAVAIRIRALPELLSGERSYEIVNFSLDLFAVRCKCGSDDRREFGHWFSVRARRNYKLS
jgi:hypothetical protein